MCLLFLQVGDLGVQALTALTKLRILSLAGCENVTDRSLFQVAAMHQLEALNLMWCSVTDRGQSAFCLLDVRLVVVTIR